MSCRLLVDVVAVDGRVAVAVTAVDDAVDERASCAHLPLRTS